MPTSSPFSNPDASFNPDKRLKRRRPNSRLRLFFVVVGIITLLVIGVPAATVLLYRYVTPPQTHLMSEHMRKNGSPVRWKWVAYQRLSPHLIRAVVAAEDSRFCTHSGFDWGELRKAWRGRKRPGRMRGASTLTNQTAKNLFLWPERSYLRKALEAAFTVQIEALWPKKRIVEVYLNIVEWGPGLFGAEAASRHYFRRPASRLTPYQASMLAAILPNPHIRSVRAPSRYTRSYAARIRARMGAIKIGRQGPCLKG